ncbi:MAG: GNAT family N-acetyltransferase [Anaerolineales bacterium]|nr:GNAT family N-acetyltransferase [Anaerolineales bacterium]
MKFTLHNNFSELDPVEWNALLSESISDVPFLRHEYLSAWWATCGGGEWEQAELVLVSARESNRLIGIAPLFLTEQSPRSETERDDGQQALMLLGSIEISDYLDLIVRAVDLPRFLSGTLDFLASNSALARSTFDWYNLPDDSPTLAALKVESAKRGWDFTAEPFRPSLSVPLPGDFEEYLAGIDKKQRHEIRRKMRRAAESAQNVHWYIVSDESTLDAEAEACCHLMAQDPAKQAFLTQTMRTQMKTMIHAAFKAGILQLAFLEVDGKKAAGYLNFDYGNRIWVYNSGLDFSYKDLSPGWVLLGYLLQWANENGRSEFDFMRGDEDYKYKFGGIRRDVMRVRVER